MAQVAISDPAKGGGTNDLIGQNNVTTGRTPVLTQAERGFAVYGDRKTKRDRGHEGLKAEMNGGTQLSGSKVFLVKGMRNPGNLASWT